MATNRKRVDLSVKEKLRIIETYDKLNLKDVSQREAAVKLGVPQVSLSKLLNSCHELITNESSESRKRKRAGKCQKGDDTLFLWFKQASSFNAPINCSILLQKANDFAEKLNEDFKATDGWLTRWKERHSIVYKKTSWRETRCQFPAAENWMKTSWKTVAETYNPADILNTGETALYYRATPDHCMVLKNSSASAGKKLKDRITLNLSYDGNYQVEAVGYRQE